VIIDGQGALGFLRGGVRKTSNYEGKTQPPKSTTILDDFIRIIIVIGRSETGSPLIAWRPVRIAISTFESQNSASNYNEYYLSMVLIVKRDVWLLLSFVAFKMLVSTRFGLARAHNIAYS
jgi:hypothetical protein